MKTLLVVALGLGTAASLTAEPALSLQDCRSIALQSQPALAAARAGVASAKEAVGEARAPYYPQLDVNASYHRWQRRAFLPSGLTLPGRPAPDLIGPLDDWNGGLASRVMLFDFGERQAGLNAAKARAAGAEAEARVTAADVRLNVDTAFFTLVTARELEVVAEKNLERTEAHRQLAEARRQAGAVPQADVLRLDAELAGARLQLIAAQSRVRIALGQLNTSMGRAADTPLQIATPTQPPRPPQREELDTAVTQALARRAELDAGEKRAEAARAAVAAAQANRAPKLRGDAAYGWRDTALWPDTREWQAGVSIDFPLFDGGTRRHRIARNRAELAREEAVLEQRRLQVRNEVWAAATELERSWASIAANEAAVRASEESLRVVHERYQHGDAMVTDLLDTQTALARAETSLAEAKWSYAAARSSFERAIGAGANP